MKIRTTADSCYFNALNKRFYSCPKKGFPYIDRDRKRQLSLFIQDMTEELEELRTAENPGKFSKDSFSSELADLIIRTFSFSGYMDIDIETAIKEKMEYNEHRAVLHGKGETDGK